MRRESYAEGWSLLPRSSVPEPISAIRRARSKKFANRRRRSKNRTRNSHHRRGARASPLGQCPLPRLATHAYFSDGPGCRVLVQRFHRARANRWPPDTKVVETSGSCGGQSELRRLARILEPPPPTGPRNRRL